MNSTLEHVLDQALAWSPAQPIFRWYNSANLVVLAYHGVPDVGTFERQIQFLATAMCPVTLERALCAIRGDIRLRSRSVLVTFDDGHPSVYHNAWPVLRRFGVAAVIFVVSGLVGTTEPLWWDEVIALVSRGVRRTNAPSGDAAWYVRALKKLPDDQRRNAIARLRESVGGQPVEVHQLTVSELRALVNGGVAIGNHTLTHPCLDRCSDQTLYREVAGAHERLVELVGMAPRVFAYPNGNPDPRTAPILTRFGYEAAFLFDHRIGGVPAADRFRVSRVRVNATDSVARIRLITSGLHPHIHAAMGRA